MVKVEALQTTVPLVSPLCPSGVQQRGKEAYVTGLEHSVCFSNFVVFKLLSHLSFYHICPLNLCNRCDGYYLF